MAATAERVAIHRTLPPEEQARADFYALLARLFHSAPDAGLLAAIAGAEAIPAHGEASLSRAWDALVSAASVVDADAAADEYHEVFEGVGSAEVSIYSAYYNGASSVDHPRIRLRADMAELRVAKPEEIAEPDDHYAVVFDVMRVLVAGGAGRSPASIAEQKKFFQAHLEPGAVAFFEAIQGAASANFYKLVAAVGLAFLEIESQSFHLG